MTLSFKLKLEGQNEGDAAARRRPEQEVDGIAASSDHRQQSAPGLSSAADSIRETDARHRSQDPSPGSAATSSVELLSGLA